MRNTLFAVYYRKLRVGNERHNRYLAADFDIVTNARTAALLVRAYDKTDSAFELDSAIFQFFECVQAHDDRTFIVAYSSAVHFAALFDHFERRSRPAVACGDYVEMRQNADTFLTATHFGVSAIVVYILRFESE